MRNSLRSLWSDRRSESDHEARCARGHMSCAPHALQATPGAEARPFARHKQSTGLFVSGLSLTGAPGGSPASAFRAPAVACTRTRTTTVPARPRAGQRWGELCDGEERSVEVGARSALRDLTRRNCSTTASAASVGSFSARPRREHRSGPRAAGHRIPNPGAGRPAALLAQPWAGGTRPTLLRAPHTQTSVRASTMPAS